MKSMTMRSSIVGAVLASSFYSLSQASPAFETIFQPHRGSKGGVASETIECSAIGTDLLARGGNAVDALVGTTFCVGVVGMYHSGIGGGGFMMVRDKDGAYEAIDFRESAPASAWQDMYQGNVEGSIIGGLSAGVPSEVRGLEYAHTKYGILPWKTVMQGAIHVARDGFKVSEDLVRYANAATRNQWNFLVEDPVWAQEFAPDGELVKVGDIMKRERYARTLERIANEGADVFYTGEIAESMIKTIQDTNGTMTLDDLANYQVVSRPVITMPYRGLSLHGIGSPAGGAVSLHILKIMEQYHPDMWSDDIGLTVHRFDEAMRFAYSARSELGDPSYVHNVYELESQMISTEKAKEIQDRILDNRTLPVEEYNSKGIYTSDSHGTSHISTADASGMATSLTTTVNLLFGAQIMDPLSGVIINNEMNDFSIPHVRNEFGFVPSEANFIRPNKRPLSSITPIIISDPITGALIGTVGAAGGSRIVSSTAQVIWHALEHNLTLTESVKEPRLHDQLMPNRVLIEYAFDNGTVEELEDRGHEILRVPAGMSAVQGVWRGVDGRFEAASEPRQKNSGGLTV